MKRSIAFVFGSSLLFAVGCTASGASDPQLPDNVDCASTAPVFAEVTALAKCVVCHAATKTGAQRQRAPTEINFDTEAAAQAYADKAVSEVMKGSMPPRNSGLTLTEAEKQQLYSWAMCPM